MCHLLGVPIVAVEYSFLHSIGSRRGSTRTDKVCRIALRRIRTFRHLFYRDNLLFNAGEPITRTWRSEWNSCVIHIRVDK